MKTQNRVHNNSAKRNAISQGQNHSELGQIQNEARSALANLKRCGAAATTLCMMNADALYVTTSCCEPKNAVASIWENWRAFCRPESDDKIADKGIEKLAFDQVERFIQSMDQWDNKIMTLLCRKSIARSKLDIETEIGGLCYLLRLQHNIYASYYASEEEGACLPFFSIRVANELFAAYQTTLHIYSKILNATEYRDAIFQAA